MVKFSVIIPVYKVEKYLNQCVDSVLQQNYSNFEIILVDDGSPDNCPKICDEYKKEDSRIKVIHQVNGGLSNARNTGLKLASGDYVIFLDSDDYWDGTEHLFNIAKILNKDKDIDTVVFYHKQYFESTNSFFIKKTKSNCFVEDPSKTLYNLVKTTNQASSAWSNVVKRELIIKNGLYFKNGITGEDSDWFMGLSLVVKKYKEYKEPFYAYRQLREGSVTNSIQLKNIEDQLYIIDKWWVELNKREIDKTLELALKGFLAYLFSILIYLISKLTEVEKKLMVSEIQKRKYIFKYALNRKSKIVSFMCNNLGVSNTSKLLNLMLRFRVKLRSLKILNTINN